MIIRYILVASVFSTIIPIIGNTQVSGYEQFKILNKRKEFRISVTGCNYLDCNLQIDVTGMVSYDFICNGNAIACNSNQIIRNDTAVFIDLRFRNFTSDTVKLDSITIHDNERLILRIEKDQGFKVKKRDKVYFLFLVNNETWCLKSKFYKRKFCKKRMPLVPGLIKLPLKSEI